MMTRAGRSIGGILAIVLLASCNSTTTTVNDKYEALPADQVITYFDHHVTENGVRRSHLRADTAYMYNDSAKTHLRVVELDMFDTEGRPTTTLTADGGEYNSNTQRTIARGNVVLTRPGPDGYTIWTEELHYDPLSKRIWSDVPTRMRRANGEDMHGQSFTADDEFRNIDIPGGAGTGLPLPMSGRR